MINIKIRHCKSSKNIRKASHLLVNIELDT
nr:MAG TPA: Fibrinogen alpha chain, Fibrinogen beta CLOTTING, Blood coagulation, Disease [Caudoviricetes sp.]